MKFLAYISLILGVSSFATQVVFAAPVTLTFDGLINWTGSQFAPHFSTNDQIQLNITYDAATPPDLILTDRAVYPDSTPFEISFSNLTTNAFTYQWIGGANTLEVSNNAPEFIGTRLDQLFMRGTNPVSATDINGMPVTRIDARIFEFRGGFLNPVMLDSVDLPTADFSFPEAELELFFDGGTAGLGFRPLTPYVVPIPAAIWLFGSGMLGLVGMARHKKAA